VISNNPRKRDNVLCILAQNTGPYPEIRYIRAKREGEKEQEQGGKRTSIDFLSISLSSPPGEGWAYIT
jgi:hypothetical protein